LVSIATLGIGTTNLSRSFWWSWHNEMGMDGRPRSFVRQLMVREDVAGAVAR
jgi:hypothetical protein